MRIRDFLKDKIIFLSFQLFLIVYIVILLEMFKIDRRAAIFIGFTIIMIDCITLVPEYYRKNKYYGSLYRNLNNMDKKQYIASVIDKPYLKEEEILYDVVKQTTKAMNDEVAYYKLKNEEYQEYIEMWIHEVKIPIACIDLICENNSSDITLSISEEIKRVDNYVEQALFFARSTNVENDYKIKRIVLSDLVKKTVRKYSKTLISNKCKVHLDKIDEYVYTDDKWLEFIISQIISNSIKYKRDEFSLDFIGESNKNNIILHIRDNGMGIPSEDISRVFDKGFTGVNGRKYAKATGMGLYLCKNLCDKLYLNINIKSEINKFTEISIIFPKDRTRVFDD